MTDDEASRLFYQHVWPLRAMVLRTARYLMQNPADADDLAQETLVKAYRSIATFEVSTHAAAWLTTILRNTRIDRARAQKREAHNVSLESDFMDAEDKRPVTADIDPSNAAMILDQLTDGEMIEALRDLPEDLCWTLLLVYVEQLDHAEAAIVMGVPVGTVKSRAHRGRQMLRERLLTKMGRNQVSGMEN